MTARLTKVEMEAHAITVGVVTTINHRRNDYAASITEDIHVYAPSPLTTMTPLLLSTSALQPCLASHLATEGVRIAT